jgi:hypothetical protein
MCCRAAVSHAVDYDDGDTEHLTLQKGRYKVVEAGTALPPKPRSKSKSEAPPPGQGPASTAAAAAKQRQTSIPLAASKPPASKAGSKAASGGSTGAGGGGGGSNQGATSGGGAAVENGKLDTGRGGSRDDRERRSSGSGEKERDRSLRDTNGVAAGGLGASGKKLPALNMSHVSKKDREAARMLLGFQTPTAQEVGRLVCLALCIFLSHPD